MRKKKTFKTRKTSLYLLMTQVCYLHADFSNHLVAASLRLCYPISSAQIGEEMSQNSFIKQYLEKQQELLRQRLEREAREAAELEGKPGCHF